MCVHTYLYLLSIPMRGTLDLLADAPVALGYPRMPSNTPEDPRIPGESADVFVHTCQYEDGGWIVGAG